VASPHAAYAVLNLHGGWTAAAQVCATRNLFVEKAFSPSHFLSHTEFDCGSLEPAAVRV